jgi:5'-methylthioadenosine phosphorylase
MPHGKIVLVLRADVGLVGGTGVGGRLEALGGSALVVPTPFGPLRGRLVEVEGLSLVVVRRHAEGHKVPPHAVRYDAIADGLRRLGVRACLSSAAVGSLRADWGVGTMAACTDFLDASGRGLTLFSTEVKHTDFSSPFPASGFLEGEGVVAPCVYACMDGPRYETPFEVSLLRKLGADVVGMTAASEAIAMREAGVAYGCLAIVTNLGTGLAASQLSHGDVGEAMEQMGEKAVRVLLGACKKAVSQ